MIYCAFVLVTLLTYFHPGLHGLKKCASCSITFHCSAVSAEWKKKKSWIQTLLRIDSELTPNPKRHDRPVRSDGFDIATWWKFGKDVRDGQKGRSGPNKKSFKGSVFRREANMCTVCYFLYVYMYYIYIYTYDISNCM